MSETSNWHEAGRYEIRLRGRLAARWAARFDGLTLTSEADGYTLLAGFVADQAALHGLLQRVRDLGLPLISVTRIEPDQTGSAVPGCSPIPTVPIVAIRSSK